MNPEILWKYFPQLTDHQREQFIQLGGIFPEINAQVNLISRKDMEGFYERHVLHSLAIAKYVSFTNGTRIMDLGTGGGFPGIPLAIIFPEASFLLVDSIGKKIKAVESITETLGLKNVSCQCSRAESITEKFHFVVTRAVATLPKVHSFSRKLLLRKSINPVSNGIIALKGGDLEEELKSFGKNGMIFPISDYFVEPFFQSKVVVHLATS